MNKVNMTSVGGVRVKSAPTPKMRPYPENYFMQKSPLSKDYVAPEKKSILSFFKNITKVFKK